MEEVKEVKMELTDGDVLVSQSESRDASEPAD